MDPHSPPNERLVNINGCNLLLYSWLRSRNCGNGTLSPAIIIEHGLGGTAIEWFEVGRLLAKFASVYLCERAGYKYCDSPQREPTLANRAADINELCQVAQILPPYLLVGHSYGGMLVRQFLADYGIDAPDLIHGMVLVDAAPKVSHLPSSWNTLLGPDTTYWEIVGLDANFAMPAEEYARIKADTAVNEGPGSIAAYEQTSQDEAASRLLERLQAYHEPLGSKPLSIIFCDESNDVRKILEHGVKNNHGTLEAQEALRRRLDDIGPVEEAAQRSLLALSSNSRFVRMGGEGNTHNAHFVAPQIIADEIRRVFDLAPG